MRKFIIALTATSFLLSFSGLSYSSHHRYHKHPRNHGGIVRDAGHTTGHVIEDAGHGAGHIVNDVGQGASNILHDL